MIYPSDDSEESLMSISVLPVEILHIIVTFYTDDFCGIVHFSSVCKEWKEIGDNNEIWMKRDLFFYCPTRYFQYHYSRDPLSPYAEGELNLHTEKLRFGDLAPVIVNLASTEPFPILSRKYKIVADKTKLLAGLNRNSNEGGAVTDKIATRKLIRDRFLSVRNQYCKGWNWYCEWLPWIERVNSVCNIIYRKEFAFIAIMICIACKVLACCLLIDVTDHASSLTIANHFGFGFLYLNNFLYVLIGLAGIGFLIGNAIKYTDLLDKIKFDSLTTFPFLIMILLAIGVSCSLIYFETKLSFRSSALWYIKTTLPLWASCLAAVILGGIYFFYADISAEQKKWLNRYYAIIALSLLFIPFGFTLLALHYDDDKSIEIIAAMIPFFLAENVLFCYTWGSLIEFYEDFKAIRTKDTAASRYDIFKCFIKCLMAMFLVGSFIIAVMFNGLSIAHAYNLGLGITCGILWCLFFEIAVMLNLFLSFHLSS